MHKKNILLFTLVHPDFLPPVYAVAQVLRDQGYHIHILTFDSFVPSTLDLGENITLESVGKHYDLNTIQRLRLRNKYTARARQLKNDQTLAVISFCPFSFHCGLTIKKNTPLIYIALEIADFVLPQFFRSPLSNYRNFQALQNIHKADRVATPSVQRSAWLAGRCHLNFMPDTILNTSYLRDHAEEDSLAVFKEIVPKEFLDKKIILYTGAVNAEHCILDLVEAFDLADDENSALIITGIKDNEYCNAIKSFAGKCKSGKRIKLFPYLTRAQMLSLQSNAHIGACLTREHQNNVKSKMIAPNKVGEYAARNLYILGIMNEYMRSFAIEGIASLAASPSPDDIKKAIITSLEAVNQKDYKNKIRNFVEEYFCMQQQLKPVIMYLNDLANPVKYNINF